MRMSKKKKLRIGTYFPCQQSRKSFLIALIQETKFSEWVKGMLKQHQFSQSLHIFFINSLFFC